MWCIPRAIFTQSILSMMKNNRRMFTSVSIESDNLNICFFLFYIHTSLEASRKKRACSCTISETCICSESWQLLLDFQWLEFHKDIRLPSVICNPFPSDNVHTATTSRVRNCRISSWFFQSHRKWEKNDGKFSKTADFPNCPCIMKRYDHSDIHTPNLLSGLLVNSWRLFPCCFLCVFLMLTPQNVPQTMSNLTDPSGFRYTQDWKTLSA